MFDPIRSAATPRVSVIVPTRDRADLLARAIESVVAQTVSQWELIVVDDGSTDGTADLLKRLVGEDSRIRVERLASPAGAPSARNCGARLAGAEYLAFLDDDAEWLPAYLERQLAVLDAAPDTGVVYCQLLFRDGRGQDHVIGSNEAASPEPFRALLRGNSIDTSCAVMRRAAFHAAGEFDEALPRLQDWDLWLRLAADTRFRFVEEPLTRGYFTSESISTNLAGLTSACSLLAAKLSARPEITRRELGDAYYSLGHASITGGAHGFGRRFLLQAIWLKPWPLQRLLMAAAATAGATPYGFIAALHRRLVKR